MKITVYTTSECQFSKQEKEYLSSHGLAFEEKSLEDNKEFLTEMLAVSNNFAGTPVTKIEKEDGQIVVLKGFTKEEFDKILGFSTAPAPPSVAEASAKATQPPAVATPPPQPPAPAEPQQELNAVLNDLQSKMVEPNQPPANPQPPAVPPTPPTPPPAGVPTIPDFGPKQ